MLTVSQETAIANDRPRNHVRLDVYAEDGSYKGFIEGFNARTAAGAAFIAGVIGSAQTAPANYIALSTATLTPTNADTTLPFEIAGTGLARKAATYGSYTPPASLGATASYALTVTYTNNTGSTVTVVSAGCFTAISGGTMVFETNFGASTALLVGDTVNVTWTFNV